jgi:hypothetical protein
MLLSNGDIRFWGAPKASTFLSSVGCATKTWGLLVGIFRKGLTGVSTDSAPTSPTTQRNTIANTGVVKYFLEKPNTNDLQ